MVKKTYIVTKNSLFCHWAELSVISFQGGLNDGRTISLRWLFHSQINTIIQSLCMNISPMSIFSLVFYLVFN